MITGKDIHQAFVKVSPDEARSWNEMSPLAQITYDNVAEELNKLIEQDTVTIEAVYCQTCKKRLFSFDTYHLCC